MAVTKAKGLIETAFGILALFASVFVLPLPLYEMASGAAKNGSVILLILGLTILICGLVLLCRGLLLRSRDLRTPRTYDSWEPTTLDRDRPENPYQLPPAVTQLQSGGPLG
ncbi:hypothetical protein [Arthrobacter rhizosphaerae]|uniref:hypothetical protein n=1 Tax=Arthrobacter rhizosphaerae TaxID=2855490 RepID=UPI001FF502EB|nr:hypothetical protein [Arthrobacter rhizosphaerae]